MYAIIETGGKQYRVEEGSVIDVELLGANDGEQVEFSALFIGEGDDHKVGAPHVEGAVVQAQILGEVKGDKVIAYKYRRRKDSAVKKGHRQRYTRVKVTAIKAAVAV